MPVIKLPVPPWRSLRARCAPASICEDGVIVRCYCRPRAGSLAVARYSRLHLYRPVHAARLLLYVEPASGDPACVFGCLHWTLVFPHLRTFAADRFEEPASDSIRMDVCSLWQFHCG